LARKRVHLDYATKRRTEVDPMADMQAALQQLDPPPTIDEAIAAAMHGLIIWRGRATGEMINDVGKAFRALVPSSTNVAAARALDEAVAAAVHDLVLGLSRATALPPAGFLVDGNRLGIAGGGITIKATGREREIEGALVALVCADHFEKITGDTASSYVHGSFVGLVKDVFRAMCMKAKPIPQAKAEARRRRRTS
jgi:hypothetical protein